MMGSTLDAYSTIAMVKPAEFGYITMGYPLNLV